LAEIYTASVRSRIAWDPEKARRNRTKHGVTFDTAKSLLEGSAAYLVIYDDDVVRIISARPAMRSEQRLFRQYAGGRGR